MRTPTKLTKEQRELMDLLTEEYLLYTEQIKKQKEKVDLLFKKARGLKLPSPQVAKRLGITKSAVGQRYDKLPH